MKGLLKKLAILAFLSFLVGVGGLVFLFVRHQSFPIEQQAFQEQKSIDGKNIRRLEIKTETADVQITKSSTDQIEVKLYGTMLKQTNNVVKLAVEQKGTDQAQIIVYESERFPFMFGYKKLNLEVSLPDKMYQQLRMYSSTGGLQADFPLQADQLQLNTGTGDISLRGYTGNQLTISSETGDVDLYQVKGGVSIRTTTGDVDDLELAELTRDVSIETATGDVSVKLKTVPASASLELESDTGEVAAELPNLSFATKEENKIRASLGTGGAIIRMQSATGDLQISK